MIFTQAPAPSPPVPPPDEGSLNDVRQGLAGALAKLSTLEGRQLCGNQTVRRVHPTILH